MFCIKCGKQINDDMAFCPNCGNQIINNMPHQAVTSQTVNNTAYQTAPLKIVNNKSSKKSSKIKGIIIALAVIVVLFLSVAFLFGRESDTFAQDLAGTWIASFGDGEYECRLKFSDSGDQGAAMLVRFDEAGESIGYFEIIYLGEVTLTDTRENVKTKETSGVIRLENISNKENSDHDYELSYMTIHYTYNPKTKALMLESNFLTDIFNDDIDTDLTFTEHVENTAYYPKTGEHYYDWFFLH